MLFNGLKTSRILYVNLFAFLISYCNVSEIGDAVRLADWRGISRAHSGEGVGLQSFFRLEIQAEASCAQLAAEHSLNQEKDRYTFRLPLQQAFDGQRAEATVCLLEIVKQQNDEQYHEVGRGKVGLTCSAQTRSRATDGLIYGTQAQNFAAIVAKFNFHTSKDQTEKYVATKYDHLKFRSLRRNRQKLPDITLRKSFVDKDEQKQNQLKNIFKIGYKNLEKVRTSSNKSNSNEAIALTKTFSQLVDTVLFYRYTLKMKSLIKSSPLKLDMCKVMIKRIKIIAFQDQKATKSSYKVNRQRNSFEKHNVRICCYQLFESQQVKRKLIEIAVPVVSNQVNSLSGQQYFYLPKTNNQIVLEIKKNSATQIQNASGYFDFGNSHNIIVLFSRDKKQKGFITALLEEQQQKFTSSYIIEYNQQFEKSKQIFYQLITANRQAQDRRFSLQKQSFSSRLRHRQAIKPLRLSTLQDERQRLINQKKQRAIIQKELVKFKTQQNHRCKAEEMVSKEQQSYDIQRTSLRTYIRLHSHRNSQKQSSSESSKGGIRVLNCKKCGKNVTTNLHLQKIFINIYLQQFCNINELIVKYGVDQHFQIKKGYASHESSINSDWNLLDLTFHSVVSTSILSISTFSRIRKKGDIQIKHLACSKVSIQELRSIGNNTYRSILASSNKIIGYLLLKFSFFQTRVQVSTTKTQSQEQKSLEPVETQTEQQNFVQHSLLSALKGAISKKQAIDGDETNLEDFESK